MASTANPVDEIDNQVDRQPSEAAGEISRRRRARRILGRGRRTVFYLTQRDRSKQPLQTGNRELTYRLSVGIRTT